MKFTFNSGLGLGFYVTIIPYTHCLAKLGKLVLEFVDG